MIRSIIFLSLALLNLAHARETLPLSEGWTFQLTQDAGQEPSAQNFKPVSLPHDWAWEIGPKKGGAQRDNGGYRVGGIGWYQNRFSLPESFQGKSIAICFDGVYRNATVTLNGHELGTRPYGFISYRYDLTEHLVAGTNVIEVQVDCSREPSTRWYHPCGIYAPVYLEATHSDSRLVHDGIYVTTPEVSGEQATVQTTVEVENPEGLRLQVTLRDASGKTLDHQTKPAEHTADFQFEVTNPSLWSPDQPTLYQVTAALIQGDQIIDEIPTSFGIRTISWDTETGFSLNGKVTKLKGVCEHLTGGPVGGAWPEALIEWKIRELKSMGCNAIRTAHNPQIPAFYHLCDKLGMLVMDEIFDGWKRKAPQDYGALHFNKWWRTDLTQWVRQNRNHPSIIIRSVGNETNGPVGEKLVELCHELDPTRPVTSGHSGSQFMDVYGVNGHSESKKFFSEDRPNKPFVATEAPHTWQVRGFYKTQTWYRDGFPNKRADPFETPDLTPVEIFTNAFLAPDQMANRKQAFQSSYDNAYVRINARQNWEKMRDLPWYSGHFRWTGFDYPGEAGYVHGGWPFHTFAGGALDLAGFRKDLYYLYRSQWTEEPMVHLLPHWTHPRMKAGTEVPVQAYSNAEEVELFFNGKSLGTQRPGTSWEKMLCQWMVPWKPGELKVVARIADKEVTSQTIKSSASPKQLMVEAD
ncbi:MAG: glycoside hydrolase family 2 TIM barrel-domain containing protein, partial [Verrucomicrobiales bacterium]